MDILKTMRNKIGLSQQDMANLLGVTRQLYSMVETCKRTLPAEAALRFAALLPILMQELPPPTIPNQVPDRLRLETEQLLKKAQQDLFKAEKAAKTCFEEVKQHQHLLYFLEQINGLTELEFTSRGQQFISHLTQYQQQAHLEQLITRWLHSETQLELCKNAVAVYADRLRE